MQENIHIIRESRRRGRQIYQTQFVKVRAEEMLAQDWNDLQAWEKLNQAQEKLEEVRIDKIEQKKNKMEALWTRIGDKSTREFFYFHKASHPKTISKELMEGNRTTKIQEEILEVVLTFYKQLYRFDALTEINRQAKDTLQEYICPN